MNFLNYQYQLKTLLKNFDSCSLVNADGALIFSKDNRVELLTTSRLVVFQIIKKYLNPNPLDIFIINDPENGGYKYSRPIFLTCLAKNLFLVWDEINDDIDFKIPPTPIFDQGKKNEFVWSALLSQGPTALKLEQFFVAQKNRIDALLSMKNLLDLIANMKNQSLWLNATAEIFSQQFNNKAHGTVESFFQLPNSQTIKMKFSAEEKQNIKLITFDFTNTHLADKNHCSSHVTESSVIKKIIEAYQIEDFFTQSVLDKIKMVMPPRSIVSKPNSTGESNQEIQEICSQLSEHNIKILNSNHRKTKPQFEFNSFLSFDLKGQDGFSRNYLSKQLSYFQDFEKFIDNRSLKLTNFKRTEEQSHIIFMVNSDSEINLIVNNNYGSKNPNKFIQLNGQNLSKGQYELKSNDQIEIKWFEN